MKPISESCRAVFGVYMSQPYRALSNAHTPSLLQSLGQVCSHEHHCSRPTSKPESFFYRLQAYTKSRRRCARQLGPTAALETDRSLPSHPELQGKVAGSMRKLVQAAVHLLQQTVQYVTVQRRACVGRRCSAPKHTARETVPAAGPHNPGTCRGRPHHRRGDPHRSGALCARIIAAWASSREQSTTSVFASGA